VVITWRDGAALLSLAVNESDDLFKLVLAHGYDTAFWWTAGIFAGGAIAGGTLLRRGPLALAGHAGPSGHRGEASGDTGGPRAAPTARTSDT
jgi:hypothetical protein